MNQHIAKDVGIWMPIYIGDMLSKTTRLTTEQIGAAYLLMMDYWKNGTIPNDNKIIASVTRLSPAKAKVLKSALVNSGLFDINDEEIISSYLDGLREKAEDNKTSKSERAKKAADTRWENERKAKELAEQQALPEHNLSNANAMPEHMQSECLSNAKTMLETCPSTSSSSIHNSLSLDASDVPDQAGASTYWQPTLDILNTKLRMAGATTVTQTVLEQTLVTFNPHYEHTRLSDNQLLAKLVTWIKSDQERQKTKIASKTTATRSNKTNLNCNQDWNNQPPPDYADMPPVDVSDMEF